MSSIRRQPLFYGFLACVLVYTVALIAGVTYWQTGDHDDQPDEPAEVKVPDLVPLSLDGERWTCQVETSGDEIKTLELFKCEPDEEQP